MKIHLKGKRSIGEEEKSEESTEKEKTDLTSNEEDLVKDNQLQHAVSLLSGWEVMKKVFKNLQVPNQKIDNRVSMQ